MKTRLRASAVTAFLLFLSGTAPSSFPQSGYFRVERRAGVWWLLDPNGSPTLSIGVDTIRYEGDRIRGTGAAPYLEAMKKLYPDRASWGQGVLPRLRSWGFNTLGAWSDPELWDLDMPYTVILDIAERAGADWQRGRPTDVFDPRFEDIARKIAQEQCALRVRSRWLIGYFSDNELRWGPDWRGKETMLTLYLGLPPAAPGKQRTLAFLRQKYGNDIGRLNRAWNIKAKDFATVPSRADGDSFRTDADEFLGLMASRYFEVCARAIHTADPNHLYLGARFAGKVPDPVIRAARAADAVSVNIYSFDPRRLVQHVFELRASPYSSRNSPFVPRTPACPTPGAPDRRSRARPPAPRPMPTMLPGSRACRRPSVITGSSGPTSPGKGVSTARTRITGWSISPMRPTRNLSKRSRSPAGRRLKHISGWQESLDERVAVGFVLFCASRGEEGTASRTPTALHGWRGNKLCP